MTTSTVWFKADCFMGLVLLALAGTWGCDSAGDGSQTRPTAIGEERGECYPNGTCNQGLRCLSSRCVAWQNDVGADDTGADVGQRADAASGDDGADAQDANSSRDISSAPAPPAGLTASDGADTSVELTWSDDSADETGFILERKDAVESTSFAPVARLGANATRFTDTDVYLGFEYTYRVRATNPAGDSTWSNQATHATRDPSLQADIVPIFDRSCGSGAPDCHARNAYAATADRDCRGWLSLENASIGAYTYDRDGTLKDPTGCEDRDLYERLTQIRAWQCNKGAFVSGDADYVIPGDPQNSYLWQKLTAARLCDVAGQPSAKMPLVGQLSSQELMTIRQWIATGAQR